MSSTSWLAIVLVGSSALGQEVEPFDHGELNSTLRYGEGEEHDSLFGDKTTLEGYQAFKDRLRERSGFEYMIEYAPISQWGAGEWHLEHELNVIGRWTAFENDQGDSGSILGWYQNGQTLAGKTGAEFQSELGTLSPVNGGTPNDHHNVLQHLAWEQAFDSGRWRFMVGKITSRVTFNMNRYAVSDREDFFSPMIVNNPVVPYTARGGLGVFAQRRTDDWYVSTMIRDADATNAGVDFDSLSTGNWESLAEFALTPELDGLGDGNYRMTWSYTDPTGEDAGNQPSSWALALSADQDFGERVGGLARFSYSGTPLRDFESRLVLGFQVKSPFEHEDDRWGLAYWTGEPADPGLRREHGFESFYRLQLSPRAELSPNLQLILDPALSPTDDERFVVGLRLRVVL